MSRIGVMLKHWGPWVLMAAVLALLAHFLDLHATAAAFSAVHPLAIALTVVLYFMNRFSMAFKWNILMRAHSCWMSHWAAIRLYLASGFVGYVIPGNVGGDVFRAARLSVAGRPGSKVSATIVLERVLGLVAILLLSTVGLAVLVFVQRRTDLTLMLGAVSMALLICTAITAMSMSTYLYGRLKRLTARFQVHRLVQILQLLHEQYVALAKRQRSLVLFFALSLVNQVIQSLMVVPILISLDVDFSLLVVLSLLPLSKAFVQFMPVPAGIGVAEGAQVLTLSLAGVPPSKALATALVLRAVDLAMLLPSAAAYALDAWHLRKAT